MICKKLIISTIATLGIGLSGQHIAKADTSPIATGSSRISGQTLIIDGTLSDTSQLKNTTNRVYVGDWSQNNKGLSIPIKITDKSFTASIDLQKLTSNLKQGDVIHSEIRFYSKNGTSQPLYNAVTYKPQITTSNEPMADPSGVYSPSDKYYYVYSTGYENNFPVKRSKDGQNFENFGKNNSQTHALSKSPDWSSKHKMWAPNVVYNPNTKKYVMTFTAGDKANWQSIGMATSDTASGGFNPISTPIIKSDDHSTAVSDSNLGKQGLDYIDSSIFVDSDNRAYLLYKVEFMNPTIAASYFHTKDAGVNTCYSEIHIQELDSTWTQFKADSTSKTLIKSTQIAAPLGYLFNPNVINKSIALVEAPYLTKAPDGTYVLFYSGNPNTTLNIPGDINSSNYLTGYATSNSPTQPFTNHGAFLTSNMNGYPGPGGLELMKRSDGSQEALFMSLNKDTKINPDNKYYLAPVQPCPWRLNTSSFHWTNGHVPIIK